MATPTAMATRTTGSRSSKLLVHLHQRQICTSGRSCRRRLPLPPRTLQVASEISEIPDVHPRHRQCSSCPLGGTWQEPSSRRPSPSRFWIPSLGIGHHTADHLTSIPEVVGEETQYPWTSTTFNVEGPTRPANPVTAPSGRRTGARPSRKLAGSVSTFPMGRPIGSTPFAAGSGVAIWSRIPTGSPKLCSVRESSTRRIRLGRSAQSASPSFAEVLDRKGDLYTRTETLVLQLRLLENSRDGQV